MIAVTIRGAKKTYRSRMGRPIADALQGVDLSIARREILGLVGPNGAGKSTLLLAIGGMISLDEGEIRVGGEVVGLGGTGAIGYAPERPAFETTATTAETLRCLAALCGMSPEEAQDAAANALEVVALAEFGDRRVKSLSRGMLQRLALAQALLGDPPVVLLDETLSGIDPVVHRAMCQVIAELPARGTAVILSSHDLASVEELATRVAVMDAGSVRGVITAAELAAPGALRERFFQLLDGGGGGSSVRRHAAG